MLLVTLIILFAVDWNIIFRSHGQFKVYEQMSPDVGILRLFPGITPQTVSQCVTIPLLGPMQRCLWTRLARYRSTTASSIKIKGYYMVH